MQLCVPAQSIGRMGRPRIADAANICMMTAIEITCFIFYITTHTHLPFLFAVNLTCLFASVVAYARGSPTVPDLPHYNTLISPFHVST